MDMEKVLKGLDALLKAMHENQCYACSHEFVDATKEFGMNIIEDAIALLKEQQKEIEILKAMGLKMPEVTVLTDKPIYKCET